MPHPPSRLRITLVGLACLALAMGVGRFAFTPLLPMMLDDGLLGLIDGGVLTSVHFFGYWLGAVTATLFPGSPRMMMRVSLFAIGLGVLGMGVADSFGLWLGLRWLCGVCSAWVLVLVSNYYVSHLVAGGGRQNQGWIFSGVGAGIALAGALALGLMVSGVGSAAGWQIMGALSLAAICVVCFAMGPEIPAVRPDRGQRASQRHPLEWRLVIAYGVMGVGYIVPATYLPVMAREIVPSPIIFGWSWPVFGAAAFVSTLLAAWLQKRLSNRRLWAVSQGIMAFGLLLPVLTPHIAAIILAGICIGGTFMIITMTGMQEVHRLVPASDAMRHIAVMTAAFATGQMIGPMFASAIYDLTGSFTVSLTVASAALMVTAISLRAERPAGRQPA